MSIFGLRSNGLASSAYKNLSRAQTSLTDNISRLASGLRINKTADLLTIPLVPMCQFVLVTKSVVWLRLIVTHKTLATC